MRKFGQNMKNCRRIQSLRLLVWIRYSQHSTICFQLVQRRSSDEAMESLGQGIQALTSLSNLKLTFNR